KYKLRQDFHPELKFWFTQSARRCTAEAFAIFATRDFSLFGICNPEFPLTSLLGICNPEFLLINRICNPLTSYPKKLKHSHLFTWYRITNPDNLRCGIAVRDCKSRTAYASLYFYNITSHK